MVSQTRYFKYKYINSGILQIFIRLNVVSQFDLIYYIEFFTYRGKYQRSVTTRNKKISPMIICTKNRFDDRVLVVDRKVNVEKNKTTTLW